MWRPVSQQHALGVARLRTKTACGNTTANLNTMNKVWWPVRFALPGASRDRDIWARLRASPAISRSRMNPRPLGIPSTVPAGVMRRIGTICLLNSPLLNKAVSRFEATYQLLETVNSVEDKDMSNYLISRRVFFFNFKRAHSRR